MRLRRHTQRLDVQFQCVEFGNDAMYGPCSIIMPSFSLQIKLTNVSSYVVSNGFIFNHFQYIHEKVSKQYLLQKHILNTTQNKNTPYSTIPLFHISTQSCQDVPQTMCTPSVHSTCSTLRCQSRFLACPKQCTMCILASHASKGCCQRCISIG